MNDAQPSRTEIEIEIVTRRLQAAADYRKRAPELEEALAELVLHARPAFRGSPFRKALDWAKELLK